MYPILHSRDGAGRWWIATGFVIFQALIIHETKDILFASVSFVPTFLFHSFQVFESSGVRAKTFLSACEKESQRGPRKIENVSTAIYLSVVS